ncbi:MAG: hypothetical protein WBM13_07130 [Bacteroidia bacterium]
MSKKKTYSSNAKKKELKEPSATYSERKIRVFKSFEEQEAYELNQMAALNSEQILQQLRKFINIAYAMHGYDPNNLPQRHSIKIIQR